MNRNIWKIYLLTCCCFLLGCAQFFILGILDQVAVSADVSIGAAGQLFTVYSLSNAIFTPVLLMVTMRFGQRRQLMIALLIMACGMLAMALSHSFTLLMASRAFMGLGNGMFVATSFVFAAKLSREGHEASGLSDIALGFSAAMVFGVPLGRVVAGYYDWHVLYFGLAVFAVIAFFVIAKVMPEVKGAQLVSMREQVQPLKDPRILVTLCITLFSFAGYAVLNTYITPYLNAYLPDAGGFISLILFLVGIMGILGTKSGGLAADRVGARPTVLVGLFVQIVVLILLGLFSGVTVVLVVLLCVFYLARWSFIPAQNLNLISLAPESASLVLGLSNSAVQLAFACGAGFGGIIVSASSVTFTVWWTMALNVGAFLVAVFLYRSMRRRPTGAKR